MVEVAGWGTGAVEAESNCEQVFKEICKKVAKERTRPTILPFLKEKIEFLIPSRIEWMHEVLPYLIERTAHLGIIKPSTSNIFVALDEAIANAIKHGNKCDPNKRIHIVAEITAQQARFTITDEGEGFDLKSLPNPTDPDSIMRPCGRGVMLIYHIMDEVRYNTRGNQIVMIKRPESDEDDEGDSNGSPENQ
jgi:serine/threonine-protein kinase RsbW